MPREVTWPVWFCPTRVDEKGRIKICADFQQPMAAYPQWFVCSLDGKVLRMYPAEEWEREKAKLRSQGVDGANAVAFAERFGFVSAVDQQARILIPRPLFDKLIGTEPVWLYWRDGHIVVLNERQRQDPLGPGIGKTSLEEIQSCSDRPKI